MSDMVYELWARLKQIVAIYATAFLINYLWEMLQMPFFDDMNYADLATWFFCFKASIGDANIILFIFILGRLLFREWEWAQRLNVIKLVYLFLTGATIAILIEIQALNTGRWRYSQIMPILPFIAVGLVPVIQLIILPISSFLVASRLRSLANRKIRMP